MNFIVYNLVRVTCTRGPTRTRTRGDLVLAIGDDHHGGSKQTVTHKVPAPEHRSDDLVVPFGKILDGFVAFRVEVVPFRTELGDVHAGKRGAELIVQGLQRPCLFERAVLPGKVEVVDEREKRGHYLCLGHLDRNGAFAFRAATIVGVLGSDPKQVFGTLGEFRFHLGNFAVSVLIRL